MNISKGVIRCKDLLNCDKEEILLELKTQFVKDIYNISDKTDSGDRRKTNTFIVTFNIPSAPKFLKIGYIRVPVTTYIPNPLRCFKCQRFGHGSRTCKNDTRCANCGQVGHNSGDCHEQLKCCNCAGTHSASSKECPKWVLEKKVQQIKAERSISFADARKIATSENRAAPTPRGQPMAAVVRSGGGPRRPTTRSMCSQTDLTWPRHLKEPVFLSSSVCTSSSSYTQTDTPVSEADPHIAVRVWSSSYCSVIIPARL